MTRFLDRALNTGRCSPDDGVERDARDRSLRQVCFEATNAAAKRLILDQEKRGECPVVIGLNIVEFVVVRDLDDARFDEPGALHLLYQLWDRRIALQFDTDRFREVTGERPPAANVVV